MYLIFITTYAKSIIIIPILEMKELSTEINMPKVIQLSVASTEFRQPKCKDHGLSYFAIMPMVEGTLRTNKKTGLLMAKENL